MAIALDATSGVTDTSNTTSTTLSHTCTGSDLILLVCLSVNAGSEPTVTYNGTSMTKTVQEFDRNPFTYIYVLESPATGTHDIVVTQTTGQRRLVAGISFSGATGGTNDGSSADGSSTTASITTSTSLQRGYVVAIAGGGNPTTLTYAGDGTQWATGTYSTRISGAAYQLFTGGADVTSDWTLGASGEWTECALAVYESNPPAPKSGFFLAANR